MQVASASGTPQAVDQSSWATLPDPVLERLSGILLDPDDLMRFRQVCRAWRAVGDAACLELQPALCLAAHITSRFPNLTHLDLSGCRSARPGCMQTLAAELPKLRHLSLQTRASADNLRVLANTAAASRLRSLDLSSADLSPSALLALTGLNQLQVLTLQRVRFCDPVSVGLSRRMELFSPAPVLQQLASLRAINLLDARPMDDDALAAIAQLPELRALSLGYRSKGPAANFVFTQRGLARLAGASNLAHLSCSGLTQGRGCGVTDSTLAAWAPLQASLLHLELAHMASGAFDGTGFLSWSGAVLQRLRIKHAGHVTTEGLAAICCSLANLETLEIQAGERWPVFWLGGLGALSRLSSLTRLSLNAPLQRESGLAGVLPALRALRDVELVCDPQHLSGPVLRGLASLLELRSLSLRRLHRSFFGVEDLAALGGLPNLERLWLYGYNRPVDGLGRCLEDELPAAPDAEDDPPLPVGPAARQALEWERRGCFGGGVLSALAGAAARRGLSGLRELGLVFDDAEPPTEQDFAALAELGSLRTLAIVCQSLADGPALALAPLTRLELLYLQTAGSVSDEAAHLLFKRLGGARLVLDGVDHFGGGRGGGGGRASRRSRAGLLGAVARSCVDGHGLEDDRWRDVVEAQGLYESAAQV